VRSYCYSSLHSLAVLRSLLRDGKESSFDDRIDRQK
jgi:hypothetical protein